MRRFFVILIIILGIIVFLFLGRSRIPDMLANNLSKKTGVAVSIDSMKFRLFHIDINTLTIGNPKGYSLPKAFSAEKIQFRAPITHYFQNNIIVDEVLVDNIYLGLEFNSSSGTEGNWTEILKQYQEAANLEEKGGKKVTIKRLVCNNIRTELMFKNEKGIRKLPNIKQIILTNISTEGGFPTDQLMSSILGQMLKAVFTQQNLGNMIKGLLDSPGSAVDNFFKPFQGLFNMLPKKEETEIRSA